MRSLHSSLVMKSLTLVSTPMGIASSLSGLNLPTLLSVVPSISLSLLLGRSLQTSQVEALLALKEGFYGTARSPGSVGVEAPR